MNKRDDSNRRDRESHPPGETQGEHDTALRGLGGDGFSYSPGDPRGERAQRRAEEGGTPRANGEHYGDPQHGGSRDPRSMSSVAWGGEGGGFSGDPARFGQDDSRDLRQQTQPRAGGGVLSGVPGQRGRGPRGYLRSDTRIADEVHERLSDDDHIDASEITVLVREGEVTLTGEVPERGMKRAAEDLVARCSGVLDVHNHLKVTRSEKG